MSLFDSASLVVTPNGYKEDKLYSIKPTDGSGDLTVTRATTATRVNSEGLIEVVPYNFIQFSEQFDNAVWTKSVSTISANATIAPNGTLTADKFIANATNSTHQLSQTTDSNAYVFSVYAKAGEETVFSMWIANATKRAEFNLATGTIPLSTVTNSTIVDVGNGWYRCSVYDTSPSTTYRIYGRTGGIYLGNGVDGLFLWGAQLNTGTSAKEYFPTTNRLNVARLDYTNSSCPSILVEPQRTNLALRSEEFDNASWTTNSNQVTVSANTTTAPDGNSTADSILTTTVGASHYIQQRTGSATAGVTYTMSVYVKKLGYDYCRIQTSNTGSALGEFRFSTKTLTISGANVVANSGKVTEMANGWFRIEMSILAPSSATWRWWIMCLNDSAQEVFFGDVTKGLYVWGFQFEVGSNATSYVPTIASSVTRNAEVISKTGISSLIGQTEGTIYAEIKVSKLLGTASRYIFHLSDGTANNRIYMAFSGASSNVIRARIFNGGTLQCSINSSTITTTGTYKLALAYKNNDIVFYINGVEIGTDVVATIPTCSRVDLGHNYTGASQFNDGINNANIWKTRLTDAECIALTTL